MFEALPGCVAIGWCVTNHLVISLSLVLSCFTITTTMHPSTTAPARISTRKRLSALHSLWATLRSTMSSAFCHRTPDALVSPPARAKSPHGDTNRRAVVLSMDDGFQVLYNETPAVPAVGFRIEERLMPTPSRVATPVSNEEWSKNLMGSSPQDLPPLPPIPSHLEALFRPLPAPVPTFPYAQSLLSPIITHSRFLCCI